MFWSLDIVNFAEQLRAQGHSQKTIAAEVSKRTGREVTAKAIERMFAKRRNEEIPIYFDEEDEITAVEVPGPRAREDRTIVGVLSDTHVGSDYALVDQMRSFIHDAYDRGARRILHPGDVVEGLYEHARWEATQGFDKQAAQLFDALPQLPGLSYHCIAGNHCQKVFDLAGVDPGRALVDYFSGRGRDDLFFYGMRDAFIDVDGVIVNLHHPGGGGSMGAHIAKMTRKINAYPIGLRVDLLLVGHYHEFALWEHRETTAILCPTFHGSGGPFGNSLTGMPAVGGLILGWSKDDQGRMRDLSVERRMIRERVEIQMIAA